MNILEKYATNCGVKIREPHVPVSYFPLREQEYIIIDNRCKYNKQNYYLASYVSSRGGALWVCIGEADWASTFARSSLMGSLKYLGITVIAFMSRPG